MINMLIHVLKYIEMMYYREGSVRLEEFDVILDKISPYIQSVLSWVGEVSPSFIEKDGMR